MENMTEHIEKLATKALIKWLDDESDVNEQCAFCRDSLLKCDICLCPPNVCDIHGPTYSLVDYLLTYSTIHDARRNNEELVELVIEVLEYLRDTGDVPDFIDEKVERTLENLKRNIT